MLYKSKPVVVEAFQYDGDLMNSDGEYYVPDWAVKALEEGKLYFIDDGVLVVENKYDDVDTVVVVGDYVMQEEGGYIWGVSKSKFEDTYESCTILDNLSNLRNDLNKIHK